MVKYIFLSVRKARSLPISAPRLPGLSSAGDELEEHQAYGDSTLGCNEATEQHKEQSGVRRNAARWR